MHFIQYPELYAPVAERCALSYPMATVMPSVTPVCFGSVAYQPRVTFMSGNGDFASEYASMKTAAIAAAEQWVDKVMAIE